MYLLNGLVTSWLNRPGLGQEAADVIERGVQNRSRSSFPTGDLIMNCRAVLVRLIGCVDGQGALYQYANLAIQGFLFVPSAQVVRSKREHEGLYIIARLDR
jgi:hypothetical protein